MTEDLHQLQDRIAALGLEVTHYARVGTAYLPMDLAGHKDGITRLVIYRRADVKYSFPGWEPWVSKPFGSHGGRYQTLEAALAWFDWFDEKVREHAVA